MTNKYMKRFDNLIHKKNNFPPLDWSKLLDNTSVSENGCRWNTFIEVC